MMRPFCGDNKRGSLNGSNEQALSVVNDSVCGSGSWIERERIEDEVDGVL